MKAYDRDIPYNNLPPLPPATELYRDEDVLNKLMIASRRLAELKGLASTLPNQSIFVNTIALREAKASSAIENIFTTDDELYKSLSYQEDNYLEGPAKEILHYREALWEGFNRVASDKTMTLNTIISVYRAVKQTHDGIRPYQAEVVIKKRGWGSLVAETVYTPPRGKGIVEKKMADLLEFLNNDILYPIDPLLKMAMAHYQFEAIHPFSDGNGRTGRILCILYLIQKQLLDLPILFLSSYILQNKDEYYLKLSGITGTQMWKPWILYMLEAVSQTAEYTTDKILRIKTLMERTRAIMLDNKLPVEKMNIPKLFEQPYIRPKTLLSEKVKSINTAKKYLYILETCGILAKEKVGKEYIWFNTDLMAILTD